ncbi:hypothetical protein TorRG33x02_255700 [Trema orientale]|uniref:Uncharacterized protein n=1 Tax=Trema orientale TaxID=63057 RepID=A0A2P5DC81_TREOI|nr:hypothetical protein TorRG33x02_255700 [Trema orientale]
MRAALLDFLSSKFKQGQGQSSWNPGVTWKSIKDGKNTKSLLKVAMLQLRRRFPFNRRPRI